MFWGLLLAQLVIFCPKVWVQSIVKYLNRFTRSGFFLPKVTFHIAWLFVTHTIPIILVNFTWGNDFGPVSSLNKFFDQHRTRWSSFCNTWIFTLIFWSIRSGRPIKTFLFADDPNTLPLRLMQVEEIR